MKTKIRSWFIALGCCLMLIAFSDKAFSQPNHSLAIRYTGNNYIHTFGSDDLSLKNIYQQSTGAGVEFAYYRRIMDHLLLGIPFKYNEINYPEGLGFKSEQSTINLDALLQYQFCRYGSWINPYVHAGVGANYITAPEEFGFGFPVGVGLNIKMFPDFYLSAQTQYRFSTNDRDGWQHGIGFHLFLGGEGDGDMGISGDSDGDGVFDALDSCPDIPGPASNRGCPELTQEDMDKVELAISMVQFETAKSVLLPQSFPVLDNIVDIMKRYPYYSLKISGHTDNVGDDTSNLALSKERAKACFDYLASKGVFPGRMTHDGYGEAKPRATNNNDEGRALNRRVEFELSVN